MKPSLRALAALCCLALCSVAAPASAHQTIINALRLEVRPREQRLAAIFRLNTIPMESWLKQRTSGALSDLRRLPELKEAFASYLLERVTLSHAGGPCQSAGRLFVLSYDERRRSVLATTTFTCGEKLPAEVRVTSSLFKEEPISQDLIVQAENQGKRGTFILNSKGRSYADIPFDRLIDIGGKLKQVYTEEQAERAMQGDLSSQAHDDEAREVAAAGLGGFELFRAYVVKGVHHIWEGTDHLLFVFSLVLAILSLRQLVLVLSAFTVGHSVSLALGAFDVLRIRPSVIEPLVALTILLIVLENLLRKDPERQRPWVALGFGVIHGFAFSQTLWDLEVLDSIVAPLVGFNVGVELGQLSLVVPAFPLLAWLRRRHERTFKLVYRYGNLAIGCAAVFWVYQRLTEM